MEPVVTYGQNCMSIFSLENGCYHEYSISLIFYVHDFFDIDDIVQTKVIS